MFESKVENKIGSNKSYNIYFVIEFFRARDYLKFCVNLLSGVE